jgi:hypothetical protein
MTDDATRDRERLAALLRLHHFKLTGEFDQPMCCLCQEGCSNEYGHMMTMHPSEHDLHVADVLIESGLGFR